MTSELKHIQQVGHFFWINTYPAMLIKSSVNVQGSPEYMAGWKYVKTAVEEHC